jgi:predicted small lipoprotein YifL
MLILSHPFHKTMKLLIFSLFILLLLGCGQKGALQRPKDVTQNPAATPTTNDDAKHQKSP